MSLIDHGFRGIVAVWPSDRWFVRCLVFFVGVVISVTADAHEPYSLDRQLKSVDPALLVREAKRRGDAKRGARVFFRSAAACAKCHQGGEASSPLGPNLATLGRENIDGPRTDVHLVESVLDPSKEIARRYQTLNLLTDDGTVVRGMLARETEDHLFLRDASNLEAEIRLSKDEIEARKAGPTSMMPDGLVDTIGSQREFFDLMKYLFEITDGGPVRETQLMPSAEELVIADDTGNLNHREILREMGPRDFNKGQAIYQGLCASCHGPDGNTPSLPTARAFGTEKLKFGADPYRMFMTLSRGNGLMAATTHLSPRERYQVVHFIRERFMKGSNPDYRPASEAYYRSLPEGTEMGDFDLPDDRDYGPALASQLDTDVTSALTINLGDGEGEFEPMSISYNLHSLDTAAVWRGGFLNLDETQHKRGRGEGYPEPAGDEEPALAGWQWGHEENLDYSREGLLPRGPLPTRWLDYVGHYLHDDDVVLRYRIDGREIHELPALGGGGESVRRTLRIGPGRALVLSTALGFDTDEAIEGVVARDQVDWDDLELEEDRLDLDELEDVWGARQTGPATDTVAISGKFEDVFVASVARGDTDGMTWTIDQEHRMVLRIPADDRPRIVAIDCRAEVDWESISEVAFEDSPIDDPAERTRGGDLRWPDVIETIGYPGLESGAYVVDRLTLPDQTPWNTWFRTSALDFFPDGRMVVATQGGDIWIVSGVDDELLNLRWKRFAGGLYEPFGVKVVDGQIYVTCKDRLTRLHDRNGDGEADFYESFCADTDVSSFFHAFNFDLQTDSSGNFYYAKSGQYTSYALPGALIKVSPDGKQQEVVGTGFRTPNGIGMLPSDRVTVSDNQGNWVPASKISLVRPGGFYGYVQTHSGGERWAPDGGRIDHTRVVPPETFDRPLIWMPQEVDNSSGGQIWVDDPRWGPLSGRMLHTSFGKGWLFYLMIQEVDEVSQAALVRFPHDFRTGIMRGRVNPHDGQVYVTGLNGWNEGGRPGLLDGGIERIRYTGQPLPMLTDCQVEPDGLRLKFNFPLDRQIANENASYQVDRWNYQWRHDYGSELYHPTSGEVGIESVKVRSADVSDDRHEVKLTLGMVQPVDQLRLRIQVAGSEGKRFNEEVHWTINQVPDPPH